MKIYWRIRSLPELDHLSDEQRSQLLKKTIGRAMAWMVFYALVVSAATIGCLSSIVPLPIAIPVGLLLGIAAHLYNLRIIRVDIQMQIIERYRGKQLPICLSCGYDLRNIEVTQCPECGAAVRAKLKN